MINMGFLSLIGKSILKGSEIIARFQGLIPPSISPTISNIGTDISEIANVIVDVESFGQTLNQPGPSKLLAAAPLVAQVILRSPILTNHSIDNQSLFMQGCTKVADGFADILNSLKSKNS